MKTKQTIIIYILLFVLTIAIIYSINNPAYFEKPIYQEITNLHLSKTKLNNEYSYQISFKINNSTANNKEISSIHLELSSSKYNLSELLELETITITANSSEAFDFNHTSNNNYDYIKVYTVVNGQRTLKASYEIKTDNHVNTAITILSIVSMILFVILAIINYITVNSSLKRYKYISNILFACLCILLIITSFIKNTDLSSTILALLPLWSVQIVAIPQNNQKK